MATGNPITIVGGGLAGLTLGIGLQRLGTPVTIWEAGHYPRHRVCGEFISGRGQGTLARLGLREAVMAAGAIPAQTTRFCSPRVAGPVREMSEPAISISRYTLDNLLAKHFRELGGELRENERWRGDQLGEGMVRASGRRVQPVVNGWRWFGLKVHARNVGLTADLEMHVAPASYLGMSRLHDGSVNICGLFRLPAGASGSTSDWREVMRGAAGSHRRQRLDHAEFDEDSFCSVAGLSLEPQRATGTGECCLGDAITMIPPVTGNGMSMAFESAELAIEPLAAYGRGEATWETAKATVARRCDEAFARRLVWARWLQRLMFLSAFQDSLVALIPRSRWLWRLLLEKTR